MNTLQNIVWPLVALGAIGAFIDFLIGEKGRKRTIKWISRTWDNYFRQITLPEFPAKEAMFFVDLSDHLFGPKLLSWRRLLCCLGIVLSCFVVFSVMGFATYGTPF